MLNKRVTPIIMKGLNNMQIERVLRKEHVASATIQQDDGTIWQLNYYLQIYDGVEPLYGLRIDKCTLEGVLADSEETFATTDNKDEALAMVEAFAKGTVTPSVLLEMVDDWETDAVLSTSFPSSIHTTW